MGSEVKQVLRMKEGTDETSYAKTSYIQKQVLLLTKSIKEKAIKELYHKQQPSTICIADLGCSSAELNNLSVVSELIGSVEKARRDLGFEHQHQDYQVYLNDLPTNDFNTIFRSLSSFDDNLKQEIGDGFGHCFVHAAPGSFYHRLFPSNHLHFVHSSYSLMWLSQVPKGVIDQNKRNIYIGRTSPPNVLKAYYDQFENDFLTFLLCRSKEVVPGGMMVLTILGRRDGSQFCKESCYMWELLAVVLNHMVSEGLIEEEKLNTFNIPQYTPSAEEISYVMEKEGSFTLNQAHVSEVSWEANENLKNLYGKVFDYYDFVKCMRSVAEPLLISHFGDDIIEELFKRYGEIVGHSMASEKNVFINVTVSLKRKH